MFVDSSLQMNLKSFFTYSTGVLFHNLALVTSKILPPSISLLNSGQTP